MILNGFNSKNALKSSDELVRQVPLIEKVNNSSWKSAIASGHCLSLDPLSQVLGETMKIYGFGNAKVEVTHIIDNTPDSEKALIQTLIEHEKSDRDYILANFIQGILTGDPEAMDSGHVSLIGAYDQKNRRVLILDVDRQWYEPYWVPVSLLLKAMNTFDKGSTRYRGYIHVTAE